MTLGKLFTLEPLSHGSVMYGDVLWVGG